MAITIPRFFPQPWAANEVLPPLTHAEMAAGYPSGTNEKPSRDSINSVLQYAVNGVLYYLTTGVPAWVVDAEYNVGSIVSFDDSFYCSTADANIGQQPDALAGWEHLPWRKGDLDALYMTQAEADERFLTPESGDERFYSQAAANELFLTQANAALEFVTKAALAEHYLTTEEANALFLTEAQADERYALKGDVVSREMLDETLSDFVTKEAGAETFITPEQAEERFMTEAQASEVFETQANAQATYLALEDAGLRIFRPDAFYNARALVLDTTSSIVYQSLIDANIGNSLHDPLRWRPWLTPIAVDTMLHYIEFNALGNFTVNSFDIPTLATHPEGIYLRIVLKGTGGASVGDASTLAHGGGEGATLIVTLQNITASMFPLVILIREMATTQLQFSPPSIFDPRLTLFAGSGTGGHTAAPGGGAANGSVTNAGDHVMAMTRISGVNGRWGVPGLRGGDGGGLQGGSGTPFGLNAGNAMSWSRGTRGCGGGGSTIESTAGPGFVQIYW